MAVPNIGQREADYLMECVKSTYVSSVGPFVDRFENEIAQLHGCSLGVATSSGTTALHAGLVALGVKPGELVICPSFTFIATANAISHQHAVPWLFDIDETSWTLSVGQLRQQLAKNTKSEQGATIHTASGRRVAAIVPVYTLGLVADMEGIRSVAQEYNIPVLADAAASVCATYNGRSIGELADLTAFSFNGNKTITSGGGGMLIGNDESLLKRLKHITSTAKIGPGYDFDDIGFNYRMTNVQAAVGCAQLERVEQFVSKKKEIRQYYQESFEKLEDVSVFPPESPNDSVCWLSGVVLGGNSYGDVRVVEEQIRKAGVEARTFWKPVHLQAPYQHCETENLDSSERIWDRILTLPCSTGLTGEQLNDVVSIVTKVLDRVRQ